MNKLTHFDASGQAHMVNVGDKPNTHRIALATGKITMLPETFDMVQAGSHKKGDVLGIARIAGIQAAKKTSDLIPLCHPLALTHVSINFTPNQSENSIICEVRAETTGPTGVEMEALTAFVDKNRRLVAGVAAGVDGVFMEVHEDPPRAKSDAANALRLDLLPALLDRLVRLNAVAKS